MKNYRSTQVILDRAYRLIQNNNPDRLEVKEKINKKLNAVKNLEKGSVEFIRADRVENEAEAVARKITELIDEHIGSVHQSADSPGVKKKVIRLF